MDTRTSVELSDLLGALDEFGFKETQAINYSVGSTGSDWRVYTRQDDAVMRVLYVSDASDVIAKDAFSTEGEIGQRLLLRDMLSRYEGHREEMARIAREHEAAMPYAVVGGAVLGAVALRIPGALLGAAAGYGVNRLVRDWRLGVEDRRVNHYLSERNMRIGDDAIKHITRGAK